MDVPAPRASLRALARPTREQLRRTGLAAAAGVAVVLAFVAAAAVTDEPFKLFSKEPAESADTPLHAGWLAQLTAAAWLSSAATSLLAGGVLHRSHRPREAAFLLWFGAYTAVLGADDLLLLHEAVNARLFSEVLLYAAYGVAALALLVRFPAEVARSDGVLLLVALALWGASVAFDVVQETWGVALHVLEDGSKVVGVVVWAVWLVGASYRALLAREG